MTRSLFLLTMAAAATFSLARAQNPASTTTTTTQERATGANKGAVSDSLFAMAAASSGLAEVTISKIGLERATDTDVKTFSQKMIDEHTKANRELMDLAVRKRIGLPMVLDYRAQFCGQNLAGLSGEDFDRCYAKAQMNAHMEAVAMFEAEAERGQDPDLKAWAARTLPHVKEHLSMIKPHAMKAEKEKPSTDDARKEK